MAWSHCPQNSALLEMSLAEDEARVRPVRLARVKEVRYFILISISRKNRGCGVPSILQTREEGSFNDSKDH